MPKVLIVEDQAPVAKAIALLLELNDIDSVVAREPAVAMRLLAEEAPQLIIQDMNFAPGETSGEAGAELFRAIHERDPDLPILILTAYASLESAVQLMREGASDYVAKPWDDAKLLTSVKNLLRVSELQAENLALKAERHRGRAALAERYDLCGLVYRSQAMHDLLSLAVRVARSDLPVLIVGPNGTGKEKVAEVVVANSARRDRPFVRVNVGGLPETLLEAELFGAEAGAYTGSSKRRVGRFEAADGGTLLLDEIGTLPAAGQTRLLRVLQSGEFERLGSSVTRKVDIRVIAATNADLQQAQLDGEFREDLYYRLNVIELVVPSLQERKDDIVALARHFLAQGDGAVPELSEASVRALEAHSWPGNVRELENCISRARVIAAAGAPIEPADLGLGSSPVVTGPELDGAEAEERQRIEAALVQAEGVLARAAAELGLSRQALYRRMHRLGIALERRLKA